MVRFHSLAQPQLFALFCFCIVDPLLAGVLRLEMSKDLYERAGLVGRAISEGGRKHVRARFCKTSGTLESLALTGTFSGRSGPEGTFNGPWQERVRADSMGFQERPGPLCDVAGS